MKNSTLGRKPGNDMKKDAGLYKPVRGASQAGDGADFAFNGQMGDGVNRAKSSCYAGNQIGLSMPMNAGPGPRTGNASSSSLMKGTSPDLTIATAAQGHNIGKSVQAKCPPNADKINAGAGPRKGNE